MKLLKVLAVCFTVLAMAALTTAGTLEDVKVKGFIQAGVNGSLLVLEKQIILGSIPGLV